MSILYVVATPIGNLEDITLRALRILREVDLIACEDTRRTIKLLNHFEISKPLLSYHEHNERTRTEKILSHLYDGKKIALVTDAGTPLISDPGKVLVQAVLATGYKMEPIPGPSALTAALSVSGLQSGRFLFEGFLPPKKSARQKKLRELSLLPYTLVFYESPYRVVKTLADMTEVLGERPATVARELTKVHEEIKHGLLSELSQDYSSRPSIKGEFVIVVGGIKVRDRGIRKS